MKKKIFFLTLYNGKHVWKSLVSLPYHLNLSIYYNVHLSCNLSFSANQVTWGEYSQLHLQDELVQELRLAFLQKRHLMDQCVTI